MKELSLEKMENVEGGDCLDVALGVAGMAASVASGPGSWAFIGFIASAQSTLRSWDSCF